VGLISAEGVTKSVEAGVVSAVVVTWVEVGMVVVVAGGSGVGVAGTVIDKDVGTEAPGGGVISSASEQAARDREMMTRRMVKRNFMKDPFRVGYSHLIAFLQMRWNEIRMTLK
jgi:ABC-type transporter Mla maintaining outer membrane lipid asymmetry ATPase subunit MlaF